MKTSHFMKTFVLAAIMLAITVQKGSGFVVVLFLPVYLVYLIYNAVRMSRGPDERKNRGIRMAIWSVVLVLAGAVQTYWCVGSRGNADMALQKVLAYREHAGAYPASLGEVALDDRELQEKWHVRYSVKEGKPRLTYQAPIMPLTMYEYDFETRAWQKNAY